MMFTITNITNRISKHIFVYKRIQFSKQWLKLKKQDKIIIMRNTHLVTNVNVRLNLDDMKKLKNEAKKLRVPVSTYCRTKLTKDLKQE